MKIAVPHPEIDMESWAMIVLAIASLTSATLEDIDKFADNIHTLLDEGQMNEREANWMYAVAIHLSTIGHEMREAGSMTDEDAEPIHQAVKVVGVIPVLHSLLTFAGSTE